MPLFWFSSDLYNLNYQFLPTYGKDLLEWGKKRREHLLSLSA